jgi:antitoxin (DNA-binding transcriptional repressor) of toxin-antitoxin stability system
MYNVHMHRYTVAQARQHLAEVLDEVETGAEVVIERRGVKFIVKRAVAAKKAVPVKPRLTIEDPGVAAGTWSWDWSAGSLAFTAPKNHKNKRP